MRSLSQPLSAVSLAALVLLQASCSDNDSNDRNKQPDYLPINQPVVELPPDEGEPFLLTTTFDLEDVGYEQVEYFLSGEAQAFTNTNELQPDGKWQVEPEALAAYKTRVLLYRPIEANDFSGTVVIEWLNVTSGFDLPVSWAVGHTQMLRAGHVWAGLSAQKVGIDGSEFGIAPLHLKAANPARYGDLSHPGDSFSYDMFSQVVQALRQPGEINMLEDLQPTHFIATGQSQSASRLMTYINAIQPLYGSLDGFMIQSRGSRSSPLAQEPQVPIPTPDTVTVRVDSRVPVMNVQTESEVVYSGSVNARQPDNETFRLWEIAGAAHNDYYGFVGGRSDTGSDPKYAVIVEDDKILGFIQCSVPLNAGPLAWVFNAALAGLENWVRTGDAPPKADRLAVTDDLQAYQLDDLGNALGGIRTPHVDAPAALLTGAPSPGDRFCSLFGGTQLFSAEKMVSLYIDKAGYVQAVSDAADDAFEQGFLLAPDVARIKEAARLQWDLLGI